ncbi:MAG: undecaprenyldiphospho-muramoylpentapeptide beta-N-acetylglucosaminyltransferase [Clostridia bacterium]|nr:undecaprenyldiphospho-muramoylpentapeptide beta-N-acetylglucosaminyltransferase [Clostridia bacterium]
MKVIVSGGGTGGHIYPAISIAEEIKMNIDNVEILYIGTKDSLEDTLVSGTDYIFKSIHVKGMPRKLNKKSFIAIKELFLGLSESKKIIREFKPDIVIGTGGYVSGPVVFSATRLKIPTVIHEQNAFPGITNKILSRYVDKVLITFEDSRKYFKKKDNVILTGNPLRSQILNIDKESAYDDLNISRDKPFIVSFGGSGGQMSLNNAVLKNLPGFLKDGYQLYHITGKTNYDSFMEALNSEGIQLKENIKIFPYFNEMPKALSIADLVITSGGAITLAEISVIGIPSILIPKAYTAENHQEYNARSFMDYGAAIMILEKELEEIDFFNVVKDLVEDKDKLTHMTMKAKELGKANANQIIFEEIRKLI